MRLFIAMSSAEDLIRGTKRSKSRMQALENSVEFRPNE
jgi:hypothetical protein